MKYKQLLFDLDGTLTDSGEGILNSVMYALKEIGEPIPPKSELYSFVGPPLKNSFMEILELDEATAIKAMAYYREYFSQKGLFENEVYEGVKELLVRLNEQGYQLYVATSKPEKFAKEILDYFDLTNQFKGIYGASLDSSRLEKAAVIAYAMASEDLEPQGTLMIGDRKHDVLGAKENKLNTLGVLYGYGNQAELENAGAIALVETPAMIAQWLSKNK